MLILAAARSQIRSWWFDRSRLILDFASGWFGSLRVRYFGERPLIEDGSVTSDSSIVWNLRAGYRAEDWTFKADLLNLADSDETFDWGLEHNAKLDAACPGEVNR